MSSRFKIAHASRQWQEGDRRRRSVYPRGNFLLVATSPKDQPSWATTFRLSGTTNTISFLFTFRLSSGRDTLW